MIHTFIQTIVQNNELFVIEDKEGAAMSQSLLFQNEDGSPVGVICFWSDKKMAQNCCAEDWKEYRPQAICLATFIEDYLIPTYNESLVAGLDFNADMEGTEADPLNILELLIARSEEHTSELQSRPHLVCRLLLEKKKHIVCAQFSTTV